MCKRAFRELVDKYLHQRARVNKRALTGFPAVFQHGEVVTMLLAVAATFVHFADVAVVQGWFIDGAPRQTAQPLTGNFLGEETHDHHDDASHDKHNDRWKNKRITVTHSSLINSRKTDSCVALSWPTDYPAKSDVHLFLSGRIPPAIGLQGNPQGQDVQSPLRLIKNSRNSSSRFLSTQTTRIHTEINQDLSSSSKYRNENVLVETPSHVRKRIGRKVSAW